MKCCNTCGVDKPYEDFPKDPTNGGRRPRCLECRRMARKITTGTRSGRNLARAAVWVNDLKREIGCKYCSEAEPVCLDYHHRDPADKLFKISGALGNYAKARIVAEIAKCDLVCANCHRKLHAGIAL